MDVLEEALKDGRKASLEEEEDDGTLVFCPEVRGSRNIISRSPPSPRPLRNRLSIDQGMRVWKGA